MNKPKVNEGNKLLLEHLALLERGVSAIEQVLSEQVTDVYARTPMESTSHGSTETPENKNETT